VRNLYEAMFIIDSARAKDSYAKIDEECQSYITRHGGQVIKSLKWDDRRLTYDVKKVKRGTYILIHFEAEGPALAKIERQARISDVVLRVLVTCDTDGVETLTGASSRPATEEAAAAPAAAGPAASVPADQ
jgi:small subunit ribosomal protein S6